MIEPSSSFSGFHAGAEIHHSPHLHSPIPRPSLIVKRSGLSPPSPFSPHPPPLLQPLCISMEKTQASPLPPLPRIPTPTTLIEAGPPPLPPQSPPSLIRKPRGAPHFTRSPQTLLTLLVEKTKRCPQLAPHPLPTSWVRKPRALFSPSFLPIIPHRRARRAPSFRSCPSPHLHLLPPQSLPSPTAHHLPPASRKPQGGRSLHQRGAPCGGPAACSPLHADIIQDTRPLPRPSGWGQRPQVAGPWRPGRPERQLRRRRGNRAVAPGGPEPVGGRRMHAPAVRKRAYCLGMLGRVVVLAAAATCTETEARWRRQRWRRRRIEPPQPGARCRAREGREGRGAGGGGEGRERAQGRTPLARGGAHASLGGLWCGASAWGLVRRGAGGGSTAHSARPRAPLSVAAVLPKWRGRAEKVASGWRWRALLRRADPSLERRAG